MIIAVVAVILLAVTMGKLFFASSPAPVAAPTAFADVSDAQVQRVAANFLCGCTPGCGELPLAECNCDMQNGAREAKGFIRAQLERGLAVDEVVQKVAERFGYNRA